MRYFGANLNPDSHLGETLHWTSYHEIMSRSELTDSEALGIWIPRIVNPPDLEALTVGELEKLQQCFVRLSSEDRETFWNKFVKGLFDVIQDQPEMTRKAITLLKQVAQCKS